MAPSDGVEPPVASLEIAGALSLSYEGLRLLQVRGWLRTTDLRALHRAVLYLLSYPDMLLLQKRQG